MLRILYTLLLRLHPRQFQARFGDEMQLNFEEARHTEGSARLLLDAVLSLFRQHLLRYDSNHRLPSLAGKQVLAGVVRLSGPPHLGVRPYRLFQGGVISFALFLTVGLSDSREGPSEPLRVLDKTQVPLMRSRLHHPISPPCTLKVAQKTSTPAEMMDLQVTHDSEARQS